ncbi:MAG: hypothetical protein FWF50_02490 [Defluviitaleaceae bacterium]|nr:hypothetical protein [Defluviitaleaceae bacterium]
MDEKELEKLRNSLNELDSVNTAESGLSQSKENEQNNENQKDNVENTENIDDDDISDSDLIALLESTLAAELREMEEVEDVGSFLNILEDEENGFEKNEAYEKETSKPVNEDNSNKEVTSEKTNKEEKKQPSIKTEQELTSVSNIPSEEAILENSKRAVVEIEEEQIEEDNTPQDVGPQVMSEKEEEYLESLLAQTLAESQAGSSIDENNRNLPKENILEEVEKSLLASIVKQNAQNNIQPNSFEEENENNRERLKKVREQRINKQQSQARPQRKRKKSVGFTVFLAASAAAAIFIGFTGARHLAPEQEREALFGDFEDSIHIGSSNGGVTVSNSNFIFVQEGRAAGQNNFFLNSMVLDNLNTTFFFDEEIDWSNFSVSLIDDIGREYNPDHSFFVNTHPNMLIFNALYNDAAGAILTITDNNTFEEAIFPLEFTGTIVSVPTSHIHQRTSKQIEYTEFALTGGYFTPVRSVVYYTIKGDAVPYIENAILTQGARDLVPLSHTSYYLDSMRMGRLEFPALNNLSGNIYIRFPRVTVYEAINELVDVSGLMANTIENRINIETDSGTLTLLRMARFGENFVMIIEGQNLDGDIIETVLDAGLLISTADGSSMLLFPEILSGAGGTDIIFSPQEGNSLPANITGIQLVLDGIIFDSEAPDLQVNLDTLLPAPYVLASIIKNQVSEYFIDSLYHSATPIITRIDPLNFYGVFSVRFHNSVTIYYIEGIRTSGQGENWHFGNTQILETWFRD